MNPNIYLAYMVFLGLDQEEGTAKELAQAFKVGRINRLFRKMNWNSGFDMLVHRIAYDKYRQANMDFIYEAKKAWAEANATKFIAFLEQYGFKK